MTGTHEAWDAQLTAHLDDLRIDLAAGIEPAIPAITASLKRYGFALLSGLSPDNARDTAASQLESLASRLGRIVPQSPRGETVEDVRDFSDTDASDNRGYRSRGELSPHSDPSTMIALYCLHRARSGGESYLVNVRAIHDRIAATDAGLLAELYRGFPFWHVEGQHGQAEAAPAPEKRPILAERDGLVSCVYYRPFVEMAAAARGESLTDRQLAALDQFDAFATSPELALRFQLEPGQTMLLHNRTVLHARTDYEDWPEPERRRHLIRVWIDAPELLPAASFHELGDLFAPKR